MKYRIGLTAMVVLVLVILVLSFGLTGASYAHKIIPGVRVGSLDLGGLTRAQAEANLAPITAATRSSPMVIKYRDKVCRFQAGELGVDLDLTATVERALRAGQSGSLWQRLRERQRIKAQGLTLTPVLAVEQDVLEKRIEEEFGEIIMEPQDAGFKITPADEVEIVPGRAGQRVSFATLTSAIIEALERGGPGVPELELPLVVVTPRRSAEEIENMGINGLIAQFGTKLDPGLVGRTYNVKVAAAALDGLLVAPGEEFSFNRLVGPRSSEAGYKNALVIVNNEFVEGIGGGVCQVSSTLYNAVLLAGLQITERSNHSLPVSYVPIGRDATVVYDALDFRFINNQAGYIYIKSLLEGDTLTFKIYGNRAGFPRIELSSRILEEIEPQVVYEQDPHLAQGEQVVKQQGTKGFRVSSTRTIWRDGQKYSEDLPASYYKPAPRIIALGTGAVQPTVIVPQQQLPGVVPAPEMESEQPGDVTREEPAPEPGQPAHSTGETGFDEQWGTPAPEEPDHPVGSIPADENQPPDPGAGVTMVLPDPEQDWTNKR